MAGTSCTRLGSSPLARGAPRSTANRTPSSPAHPRSRGEHDPCDVRARHQAGSSPLARGAHRRHERARRGPGLIPARAGSTCRRSRRRARCPAHPRSRGEHLEADVLRVEWQGSSPLARGARCERDPRVVAGRLIPARAGSTRPRPVPTQSAGAHPRSRGEHVASGSGRRQLAGSSPLARGALPHQRCRGHRGGLIPTRAGSTFDGR